MQDKYLDKVGTGGLVGGIKQYISSNIDVKFMNGTSSSNPAANVDFVNSSIGTETANFIGTFASVSDLLAYEGTVTNNDYAFVVNRVVTNNGSDWTTFSALDNYDKNLLTDYDYAWVINSTKFDLYRFDIINQVWEQRATNINKSDVTLNAAYNRYKYNGNLTEWNWEYRLNNSSFTAVQWAAINSGITSDKVAQINTNTLNITALQSGKQNKLTAGENISIDANNVISALNILNNYELINRQQSVPAASATSPDFIQVGGVLYQKIANSQTPSVITDLTDTTWTLNDSLNIEGGELFLSNINFTTSGGNSYSGISIGYLDHGQDFAPNIVCYDNDINENNVYNSSWNLQDDRTITFTGGTNVTNSDLITWLQANAVLQGVVVYSYDTVKGQSCITGSVDPTTATIGELGQFYLNATTGKLFQCTAISSGTYTWTYPNVNAITLDTTTQTLAGNKILTMANNNYSIKFQSTGGDKDVEIQTGSNVVIPSVNIHLSGTDYAQYSAQSIGGVKANNSFSLEFPNKSDFLAVMGDIFPKFSTSVNYAVGALVSYGQKLYVCSTAHNAGNWVAADFTETTLEAVLSNINAKSILTGSSNPTAGTVGELGQFYLNTDTRELFQCVSVGNLYSWVYPNIKQVNVYTDQNIYSNKNFNSGYNIMMEGPFSSDRKKYAALLGWDRSLVDSDGYDRGLICYSSDVSNLHGATIYTNDRIITAFTNNQNNKYCYLPYKSGTIALLTDITSRNFQINTTYNVGDLVIFVRKLYKCVNQHTGDWVAADFVEVTIEDLLSGKANISDIPTSFTASEVDSESATSGQVLTADGNGGASWQNAGGAQNAVTLDATTQAFSGSKTLNLGGALMFGDPQTSGRGVEFQVNDNGYEFISLLNGSNNTFRLVSNSSKHYISHSLGSATQYELTIPLKTGTLATLDDITTPQNMVTTNTDQTLSGVKTWTNEDSSYSWELITSYDGINSTRTDKGTNTTSSATYNSEGFDLYVGRDDDSTYSVGIASDGTIYVYEEDGQGNTTSSDIEIRNTGNNEQLAYLSDLDDYQEVITKTTVTSGSIDEVIGFNSNGELVRSQGSGNVDVLTVYEVEDIVNQQLYTCNSITVSVTNGTYTGNTVIPQENGTATVEIIPIAGYGPDSTTLTVSGASYTYDSQTKTISLSAPTGNVTISVTCSPNILLTSNNEVLNTSGGDRILFN